MTVAQNRTADPDRSRTTIHLPPPQKGEGTERSLRVASLLAFTLVALGASTTLGQSDQPTLDELLDLTPVPEQRDDAAQPAGDAPPRAGEGDDLAEDVQRLVTEENPADLLEQALRQMDDVSVKLGRELDPGVTTQREQESILAKLDQVIAAARQQQASSSSQGGSGSQSGQNSPRQQDAGGQQVAQQNQAGQQPGGQQQQQTQASDSNPGAAPPAGPGADAEQAQRPLDELRSEWGNLPPRLRDELTEGLSERFSPLYRELTEAYYRRLAEEQ